MADKVTVPNFSQYNFEIGDTVEVVTKQNGVNAALQNFGNSLNATIEQFNEDVADVEQAKDDLNADQLVHAPGSGLPNEAGALALLSQLSEAEVGNPAALREALELSAAATRGIVGGAGDLMARGAFGLGTADPPLIEDFNIAPVTGGGFYSYDSSTTNSPSHAGAALYMPRSNGRGVWIAATASGSEGSAMPKLWVKPTSGAAGDFGEWGEFSFLRSENANGRYAVVDGAIAICSRDVTLNHSDGAYFFSMPVQFSSSVNILYVGILGHQANASGTGHANRVKTVLGTYISPTGDSEWRLRFYADAGFPGATAEPAAATLYAIGLI